MSGLTERTDGMLINPKTGLCVAYDTGYCRYRDLHLAGRRPRYARALMRGLKYYCRLAPNGLADNEFNSKRQRPYLRDCLGGLFEQNSPIDVVSKIAEIAQ